MYGLPSWGPNISKGVLLWRQLSRGKRRDEIGGELISKKRGKNLCSSRRQHLIQIQELGPVLLGRDLEHRDTDYLGRHLAFSLPNQIFYLKSF